MRVSAQDTAQAVLDVVPAVMRTIRTEMRTHRGCDINVPQFRTLGYLNRYSGVSLSQLAEHIGLTLPSMSKLVDGLVARKLVSRQVYTGDRRRVTLALTARGRASLASSLEYTEAYLAERLAALSDTDRATIVQAMQLLDPIFRSEREVEAKPAPQTNDAS